MYTQFIDCFTNSPAFKAAYFTQLAKYRKARPLYELIKRMGHSYTPDNSFSREVRAAVRYRTAKAKGIILVSQDW